MEASRIKAKADGLYEQMFRLMLDPNVDENGWIIEDTAWRISDEMSNTILKLVTLLVAGGLVRTGYYATDIKGYHRHVILHQARPKSVGKRMDKNIDCM